MRTTLKVWNLGLCLAWASTTLSPHKSLWSNPNFFVLLCWTRIPGLNTRLSPSHILWRTEQWCPFIAFALTIMSPHTTTFESWLMPSCPVFFSSNTAQVFWSRGTPLFRLSSHTCTPRFVYPPIKMTIRYSKYGWWGLDTWKCTFLGIWSL